MSDIVLPLLQLIDNPVLTMLKASSTASMIYDENGKIIFWNTGSTLMFGITEEEALGKHMVSFFPDRYKDVLTKEITDFREESSVGRKIIRSKVTGRDVEFFAKRKNGEEFLCEVTTVCYSDGVRRAFTVFVYDMTYGIMRILKSVSQKLETIDSRLNTLETKISGVL